MNRVWSIAVVAAGLVCTLGGAVSWGQVPPSNDTSDSRKNTGSGTNALRNVTPNGSFNTAFGSDALGFTTSGKYNTAVGYSALYSNTTGTDNTATGEGALGNNNGSNNTATGSSALIFNSTGHDNTASGYYALALNTTGIRNTASGQQALYNNGDGYRNTAMGALALFDNISGTNNSALGVNALTHNTGSFNTAAGVNALYSNTTGANNAALGLNALYYNTTGLNNTALGGQALRGNTTGATNTALGVNALVFNTTGGNNLALGYQAGYNLTTGANNIAIGNLGVAGEASTIRLGSSSQTRTFIAGIAGVPISGATVTINNAGQLGILASSARYKKNVQPLGAQSEKLRHLRPVTFEYKHDPQGVRQYGLIAEEVAQVYPELVVRGADGKVESVQYHELIPLLLNEVQHQQQALGAQAQELTALKAQNESLRAALAQRDEEQQTQNAALAARLERLEQGTLHTAALVKH